MQSERPVDPFSLPGPLPRPSRAAQGSMSWRTALGDVWFSLDPGAGFGPPARDHRAQQGMVEATARRLAACRLAARPWSFDHQGAWDSDQDALLRALRDFMDTPEAGWDRRDPRVLEPLRANLGRAWMAISLIDTSSATGR